jgi:hypothetical protein
VLECRVYARNKIGSDNFIGGTKDAIELLLAEGASCGTVVRELSKHDTHGNQRKTRSIVEFTIVTISKTTDAAGLNIDEAFTQGGDAFHSMTLIPSSSQRIQAVVDLSTVTNSNIKSVSDVWDPLLQKIKIFSRLVDTIAEVRNWTGSLVCL